MKSHMESQSMEEIKAELQGRFGSQNPALGWDEPCKFQCGSSSLTLAEEVQCPLGEGEIWNQAWCTSVPL